MELVTASGPERASQTELERAQGLALLMKARASRPDQADALAAVAAHVLARARLWSDPDGLNAPHAGPAGRPFRRGEASGA